MSDQSTMPAGGPPVSRSAAAAILVRVAWEGVLLLAAVALTVTLLVQADGSGMFRSLLYAVTTLGLLASAFGLSVRAGTPNLAVTGIASLTGVIYVRLLLADFPPVVSGLIAIVCAAVFGVLVACLGAVTRSSTWAASVAALAVCALLLYVLVPVNLTIMVPLKAYNSGLPLVWLPLLVLGSLVGAGLWLIPDLRSALSAIDPGALARRGSSPLSPVTARPPRWLPAIVGLAGSSLVAGASGLAAAQHLGAVPFGLQMDRLPMAAAAMVLGGISVVTGRGGVTGTLAASWLLSAVTLELGLHQAPQWAAPLVAVAAILAGLSMNLFFDSRIRSPHVVPPARMAYAPATAHIPPAAPAPADRPVPTGQ